MHTKDRSAPVPPGGLDVGRFGSGAIRLLEVKVMRHVATVLIALCIAAVLAVPSDAATIQTVDSPNSVDAITGEVQDPDGASTGYVEDSGSLQVGEEGSAFSNPPDRKNDNAVVGFTLPTLDLPEIQQIDLSFTFTKIRDDSGNLGDLQVYLMDTTDPTTDIPAGIGSNPVDWFYDQNGNDTRTGVDLFGEVAQSDASTAAGDNPFTLTVTSGSTKALFESFYGSDQTPDQPEAFFRFNTDSNIAIGGSDLDEYEFAGGNESPSLAITVTPEPASAVLLAVAGLLALRRRRRIA